MNLDADQGIGVADGDEEGDVDEAAALDQASVGVHVPGDAVDHANEPGCAHDPEKWDTVFGQDSCANRKAGAGWIAGPRAARGPNGRLAGRQSLRAPGIEAIS